MASTISTTNFLSFSRKIHPSLKRFPPHHQKNSFLL